MLYKLIDNPLLMPMWVAILCGIIIGIEREIKEKDAGLKTSIFICVGAALFSHIGSNLKGAYDSSRVLSQVVSGVGFIGGGVIVFDKDRIQGLTSAAIIWMNAAIGILCGLQMYLEAIMCSLTIIGVEVIFDAIKRFIRGKRNE